MMPGVDGAGTGWVYVFAEVAEASFANFERNFGSRPAPKS